MRTPDGSDGGYRRLLLVCTGAIGTVPVLDVSSLAVVNRENYTLDAMRTVRYYSAVFALNDHSKIDGLSDVLLMALSQKQRACVLLLLVKQVMSKGSNKSRIGFWIVIDERSKITNDKRRTKGFCWMVHP